MGEERGDPRGDLRGVLGEFPVDLFGVTAGVFLLGLGVLLEDLVGV